MSNSSDSFQSNNENQRKEGAGLGVRDAHSARLGSYSDPATWKEVAEKLSWLSGNIYTPEIAVIVYLAADIAKTWGEITQTHLDKQKPAS